MSEQRQRSQLVAIRMTPDEKRRITAAASVVGVSMSRFIRESALAAMDKGPQ